MTSVREGTPAPDDFDAIPTSLWMEDYSQLHALFQRWRDQGVTHLPAFLREDTARVAQCSASIRLTRVNQHTLSLYAAGSFQELSSRLSDVLRDETFDAFISELDQLWQGNTQFSSRSVNYALDGRRLDVLLKGRVLPDHAAPWDRVLVAIEDITELENARRQAIVSEHYARGIFQQAPVSLWVEDFSAVRKLLEEIRANGITDFRTFTDVHPEFVQRCMSEIRVLDVNQYTLDLLKAGSKAELLARLPDIFREGMLPHFREQLQDLWNGKLAQQREIIQYALDDSQLYMHMQCSVFPGYEHDWSKVLLALTDITARKKAETYLEYLGKHDALTKLKNRSFFTEELGRLQKKGPFPLSVVIIDLNNLKIVNDQFGHAAGDALLRRTGEILAKAIDVPYQAARIGGDEFALLLPGADEKEGRFVLDNVRSLLALNNQFYPGPLLAFSMGLATCRDADRIDAMLREADMAMYTDKKRFYSNILRERRGAPSDSPSSDTDA